jgi:ABC-type Fe3+-siderophore transport system permease subunit
VSSEEGSARLERLVAWAGIAFNWLLFAGLLGAVVLDARSAAALALVGFIGLVVAHLVAGLVSYRRVMSRSWPQVPALADDDDEW